MSMTSDTYRTQAFRITRMHGHTPFGIAAMLKLQAIAGRRNEWFEGVVKNDAHRNMLVTRAQMGWHETRNLP